jgi:hypothetical protein
MMHHHKTFFAEETDKNESGRFGINHYYICNISQKCKLVNQLFKHVLKLFKTKEAPSGVVCWDEWKRGRGGQGRIGGRAGVGAG